MGCVFTNGGGIFEKSSSGIRANVIGGMRSSLQAKRDKILRLTTRKRLVLISLAQTNICIESIPSHILKDAIFCFKAQRCWFFPNTVSERLESAHSIRGKLNFCDLFWDILTEKDKNGLVLWFESGKTWTDISNELQCIEDIYLIKHDDETDKIKKYYKPLRLGHVWWNNEYKQKLMGMEAMYCTSADKVVDEIQTGQLHFNPSMELLIQSNPTLVPMRNFDMEKFMRHQYEKHAELTEISKLMVEEEEDGQVFVFLDSDAMDCGVDDSPHPSFQPCLSSNYVSTHRAEEHVQQRLTPKNSNAHSHIYPSNKMMSNFKSNKISNRSRNRDGGSGGGSTSM